MTNKITISFPFILLMALLCGPMLLFAQNRVQIIEADSIVGDIIQGERVQKIIGNVHLRTEDVDMFADIVYKYPNLSKIQAFGNVEIDTGEEIIWTDSLTYFTDIDFSQLRGRVVIATDSTTFFGSKVDYRFTKKVAHFLERIRFKDQEGILVANSGFYFRKIDSAAFRGQVQLKDSLKYIETDQLLSNRRTGYYELHGNVFVYDKENSSMLKGDFLEADSTGRRLIIGHAWLKNFKKDTTAAPPPDSLALAPTDSASLPPADSLNVFGSDSLLAPPDSAFAPSDTTLAAVSDTSRSSQPDTTHIRAKKILLLQNRTPNDTTAIVHAYHNVRIWSPDFSAVSDTALYKSKTETFELWSNAKAWHQQIQLTGPYIKVLLHEGDIKKLISYPAPFTVQHDTTIDRLNQIKGDTLKAFFEDGALQRIRVFPNSHLLRFTQKEGKPDGSIELTAPVTIIYFKNGELVELKSLGKEASIQGHYLPAGDSAAQKKLSGFSWNPKMRPQRPKKSMKPQFPPIPEEPPFELPKRYIKYLQQKQEPLQLQPAKSDSLR